MRHWFNAEGGEYIQLVLAQPWVEQNMAEKNHSKALGR